MTYREFISSKQIAAQPAGLAELPKRGYRDFLAGKQQLSGDFGFEPLWMPEALFDFQKALCGWAIRKGRGALFEDCGMGKTLQQLVWAENVVRKTNRHVLVVTPIAVGRQTVREAEKFGMHAVRCSDGMLPASASIIVTNYERLHLFSPADFTGVVCDESSILKNFDGVTRAAVTEFMRTLPYRLLCTATAAPNDYIELGTSSEALGELGYLDMLGRFFKADNNANAHGGRKGGRFDKNPFGSKFRFRGHAERDFWRWICSWGRAVRKPSDLGFNDGRFQLPALNITEHIVKARTANPEYLFDLPANGLSEERAERRRTLKERCERAADILCASNESCVAWVSLNDEGRMLRELVFDAEEVSGDDAEERKEELFTAFERGEVRALITKSEIAGFGLNWQHCAHQVYFPSHSFERWYQAIRRSWRFGQERPVRVDVVSSEGESRVLANLKRKAAAAEKMFAQLVDLMGQELRVTTTQNFNTKAQLPPWM